MIKFIQNIGEFYSSAFFNENFTKNVIERSGHDHEALPDFNKRISGLKDIYFRYKKDFLALRRPKDRIVRTYEFHSRILELLGYDGTRDEYDTLVILDKNEGIPVRLKYYRNNKPHLYVMEMQSLIETGDDVTPGLFDQRYNRESWETVFKFDDSYRLVPSIINKAISELFLIDIEIRPEFVLLLAGSDLFLLQGEKWQKGAYIQISLEQLFIESVAKRDLYSVFYFLLSKEYLIPGTGSLILEELDEDSHKVAYAVTRDLKDGVINAIELLANEVVYFLSKNGVQEKLDDEFATQLKDDCLVYVYRLLFLFYAESREELDILPIKDEVYRKGYSLEMLRDLELVKLQSTSSKDGFFFHETLKMLFGLLAKGFRQEWMNSDAYGGLTLRQLDSPLFDDNKLNILGRVRFRNFILQKIIQQLSLSQKGAGKKRGRISYSNLGINQLGSVYEGLLSYRGYFADEDFIEVKRAEDKNGTGEKFVVRRSRRGDFTNEEVVIDPDNPGREKVIPRGTFIYRLSGVDRKKSASFYTPEILTQTTVKYTLKQIFEKIESGEMRSDSLLEMKILEPAMGASAFLNEAINQIASAYLEYKQKERKQRIKPSEYRDELQKVKAFIATRNVYGVDINPTAVELGKLSLWLNVIYKEMETPFFGARLGVGNAILGAWRKVYSRKDVKREIIKGRKKIEKKEWWNIPPRELGWETRGSKRKSDEIYHFLLPDKNMLASAKIELLKDEYPHEVAHASKWKKKFCEALFEEEIEALLKISAIIDQLFQEHYREQREINRRTYSLIDVYGQKSQEKLSLFNYYEKLETAGTRETSGAPYYKLKMVMDYWCSLWFWDVRDAFQLPSREEFIVDVINILEVDLSKVNLGDDLIRKDDGPADLFGPLPEELKINFPDGTRESNARYKSNDEKALIAGLIDEYSDSSSLFKDRRISLVNQYAKKYKFFHYELEFIEVFKEKGGFDIVVGNPPWVKMLFEEGDVLGSDYPETIIRKHSAPQLKPYVEKAFEISGFKEVYINAQMEAESNSSFSNGTQNYPLLIGQQPNLYKLILSNSFSLLSKTGYSGLIHPRTVFDDPNGESLREHIYNRLLYHFHFLNELLLFSEVDDRLVFSINIYKGEGKVIDFYSMHNIFHPSSIDGSFNHDGSGFCFGSKAKDPLTGQYTWNRQAHKDRIIHYSHEEIMLLSSVFEDGLSPTGPKLINLQSRQLLSVLKTLDVKRIRTEESYTLITEGFHETNDVTDQLIKYSTDQPIFEKYELILNGPHTSVANPLSKSSRIISNHNSDYDVIDLELIDDKFIPRNRYKPNKPLEEFKKLAIGKNSKTYNHLLNERNWLDNYKLSFSKMIGVNTERTLQPAILPPKVSHINGLISVIFKETRDLVELAALTSSIVFDFLVKTMGSPNFTNSRIKNLPLGILDDLSVKAFARILRLNCMNIFYSHLWEQIFNNQMRNDKWAIDDRRLSDYAELLPSWDWTTPLRNAFERRMALIELDVIVAIELGLSLRELISIYQTTFALAQQYEEETFYDRKGRIVFTVNNALSGVGLERKTWEVVKNNQEGEIVKDTIKYELHRGTEIIYYPPFERRDRVEDYKLVWPHFEQLKRIRGENADT